MSKPIDQMTFAEMRAELEACPKLFTQNKQDVIDVLASQIWGERYRGYRLTRAKYLADGDLGDTREAIQISALFHRSPFHPLDAMTRWEPVQENGTEFSVDRRAILVAARALVDLKAQIDDAFEELAAGQRAYA